MKESVPKRPVVPTSQIALHQADDVAPLPQARPWSRGLDGILKSILVVAVLGELGILFFNILGRMFLARPWLWTLEAASVALSVIAFLGGALAYRRGEHAFVRTLLEALPPRVRHICYALVEYFV